MKTMKCIAVLDKGKVAIKNDVPFPEIGDYECLLKMKTCGFCNTTDMLVINGIETGEKEGMPHPYVLGHEGVGEVVELGKKVRNIKIGDRFIRPYLAKNAMPYRGNSGNFVEYNVMTDIEAMKEDGYPENEIPSTGSTVERCGKIPAFINDNDGALVVSLVECISAVKNLGIKPGMNVIVYGSGPMGMGVANYINIIGGHAVVCDPVQKRLDYAKKTFGLTTYNNSVTPLTEQLPLKSYDAVIDVCGKTEILLEGTKFLKPYGILGSMGVLPKNDNTFNVTKLTNNTVLHMLNFPYQKMAYIPELCDLIKEGKIKLSDFYSKVMPMEEIDKCIELITNKDEIKIVLKIAD